MAQSKAQKVAEMAHRYIDSLRMWGVDDSTDMWAMWLTQYDLEDPFAEHVRRVIDSILEGE